MIELGGGGEVASCGSSQCTQETDNHIRCGCGSALRTRQNGLAALISEGNAYALLTPPGGLNFDPPGSIVDRFITARTRTSHGGVVVLNGCDAIAIHDLCDWNRTP